MNFIIFNFLFIIYFIYTLDIDNLLINKENDKFYLIFYSKNNNTLFAFKSIFDENILKKRYKSFYTDDYEYINKIKKFGIENNFNIVEDIPQESDNNSNNILLLNFKEYSIKHITYNNMIDKYIIYKQILYKTLPYILPYNITDLDFSIVLSSNIDKHFLLVNNNNDTLMLEKYENISKLFREKECDVIFTYLNIEDSGMDNQSDNNLDNQSKNFDTVLFYYDDFVPKDTNNTTDDNLDINYDNLIFNKTEINFDYLYTFFNNKLNYENLMKNIKNSTILQNSTNLEILEYNKNLIYMNYYILWVYDHNSPTNTITNKKWNFLLSRLNYLLNKNYDKLQIFKILNNNTSIIDTLLDLNLGIYLINKNLNNTIKYESGPSLNYFINYLNKNIENFNYILKEEDNKEYFEELFYNNELIEVEELIENIQIETEDYIKTEELKIKDDL